MLDSETSEYAPQSFRHVFIISGPSGAGKASVIRSLLQTTSLKKIVNFTTRPPRESEQPGMDYHFVTGVEFATLYRKGLIAESEMVYDDFCYGSPAVSHNPNGPDCLIELDPKGRRFFVERHGPFVTSIFLLPPSLEDLRLRIQSRQPEANLDRRLQTALAQIACAREYDYIVLNDSLTTAATAAAGIVAAVQVSLGRERILRLIDNIVFTQQGRPS